MSGVFKFFSYKEGDRWLVNRLISFNQCLVMLNALGWTKEVFASIQDYTEDEQQTGCPLYFDIDAVDLFEAQQSAMEIVKGCEYLINCTPRIYFSGNRGFHLIVERRIDHPRCHELVRHFVQEGFNHVRHVDHSVYTSRRMFRIPGSPASKPGYYKIELLRRELFKLNTEDIRALARGRRTVATEHDPSKIDDGVWDAWLAQAIRELPVIKTVSDLKKTNHSVSTEITPCIVTMLTKSASQGERHSTVFTLARFFRSCDVDEDTALCLILEQPHHLAYEEEKGEVTKVVRSVYRTGRQMALGCRGSGIYPELMRSFCAAPCHFRKDFNPSPFSKEPVVPVEDSTLTLTTGSGVVLTVSPGVFE